MQYIQIIMLIIVCSCVLYNSEYSYKIKPNRETQAEQNIILILCSSRMNILNHHETGDGDSLNICVRIRMFRVGVMEFMVIW